MMAISRFRVPGDPSGFRVQAGAVVEQFSASPGSAGAELVQNLDEPELWAIVSRWADVGSYRRAFNGTAAKLVLIPLLSLAIDEPSAYADPGSVGENRPRGTVI
ncbi:MAG: antibiotic biosynthesis monooxygenase [Propionibacteriaceae bacterium]|nr:antibiotic biosynthesis monooxygenase [Propionibacteriaceae bacterium]